MSQWKVILAALVIFGSGVVVGGLVVGQFTQGRAPGGHGGHHNEGKAAAAPWQLQREQFYRHMEKELNLSPEQKDHLDKIFKQSQERTKPLWEQISPQMRAEMKQVESEIRVELTPAQQQKFDELLKPHAKKAEKPDDKKRQKKKDGTNAVPVQPSPAGATNQ